MASARKAVPRGASAHRVLVPRTQAVGIMRLAEEFVDAADSATRAGKTPHKVALYLYGHALELMIKAVLVCAGSDEKRLRRLGHDLSSAFRSARRQRGSLSVPLSARDYALIGMLSPYYDAKDLEYLATGFRRYPLPSDLAALSRRLIDHLGPAVNAFVRRWLHARRSGSSA